MATIKFNRTSEYMNKLRRYKIYVDNVQVGDIRDGGSEKFEVSPGTHTLYAKVGWCYSPAVTFIINESETKYFNVGLFKYANVLIPATGLIGLAGFALMQTHSTYIGLLALPLLCIMFYYITFGRKKYLSLNEENLYQPKNSV